MRRPLAALLAPLVVAALAACGPAGPVQETSSELEPVKLLGILPSPVDLRGPAATPADPDALAEALTGRPDPTLSAAIVDRGLRRAAVRRWRDPRGGTLTASVSVWPSDLIARSTTAEIADGLLQEGDGATAWTPARVAGSRGARRDDPARRELRLSYPDGPNALSVRGTGPVDEDALVRTLERMVETAQGGAADAG